METEKKSLSTRMKEYENNSDFSTRIDKNKPYMIRLDGRSFSKYTKGLNKPFDHLFQKAMIETMNDLVEEFSARTGYTHSDEITLVFPPCEVKSDKEVSHLFDGRVMKLVSVTAGYCSARFNYHMVSLLDQNSSDDGKCQYHDVVIDKIKRCKSCFDSRVISFEKGKEIEIVNMILWRSVHDCKRNSVTSYAREFFSHKQLFGKNVNEMIEMMKEKQFDWNDLPLSIRHGVYAKRELYTLYPQNGEDNEIPNGVIRQKITNRSFVIEANESMYELIMAKNWISTS